MEDVHLTFSFPRSYSVHENAELGIFFRFLHSHKPLLLVLCSVVVFGLLKLDKNFSNRTKERLREKCKGVNVYYIFVYWASISICIYIWEERVKIKIWKIFETEREILCLRKKEEYKTVLVDRERGGKWCNVMCFLWWWTSLKDAIVLNSFIWRNAWERDCKITRRERESEVAYYSCLICM